MPSPERVWSSPLQRRSAVSVHKFHARGLLREKERVLIEEKIAA